MKKIAYITLAITLFVVSGVEVSAETSANTNTNTSTGITVNVSASASSSTTPKLNFFQKLKAVLSARKEVRTETKEETGNLRQRMASSTQAKKLEQVKRKVANRFDKMSERFQATIEREEGIMAKIVSRMEKIKTAGGKTEIAEKFIIEAKIGLEAAKVSLVSLQASAETTANLEATASTTEARKSLIALQRVAAILEQQLRDIHKSLEKALASLRGVSTTNVEERSGIKVNAGVNNQI